MRAPRDEQRPYAKTTGGGDGRALGGYRHEFGSLRDALHSSTSAATASLPVSLRKALDETRATLDTLPVPLKDLALHLIVSHHGHARPVIAPIDPDPDVPPWLSSELARDAALRFARLQRQWGPWGLAWWEAVLRAADWAASREINETGHEAVVTEDSNG